MIKYKIGVAKIKIPYNGDTWLPRNTTKSHRIIKHACIISDIDKENLHVAFFTSWDMFRVQKEYIRNLQCTGKTLKYMNNI